MTEQSISVLRQAVICWLMLCDPAIAEEPVSEIEGLISANKWRDAARSIFAEARANHKHESSIVIGQAKAGFIEDAIQTIEGTHPASHPWLLMTVAREASFLPAGKRDELVRKALDSARSRTTGSAANYTKSGDLARIALYYSLQGAENEAKSIFSESVAIAEQGLEDEGSGGFRQITEGLRRATPEEVKPWMLAIIQNSLGKTADPQDLAFACIDMVAVAGRFGKGDLATPFVECATSAISRIYETPMQKRAGENLAKAKDENGSSNLGPSASPLLEAIREARAGNMQKSYVIVSGFGQNIYVDHKMAAYEQVFNDAVSRGDLTTALYFVERPVRQLSSHEITVWQKLAEKQSEMGDWQSASDSYRKAASIVDSISASPTIYFSDIKSVLHLGESMYRNKMSDEGRRTILAALPLLERISEKQIADRVNASVIASESLWQIGNKTEAKKLIRQAYFFAHSYDTTKLYGEMKKAQLLSSIGLSISTFSGDTTRLMHPTHHSTGPMQKATQSNESGH